MSKIRKDILLIKRVAGNIKSRRQEMGFSQEQLEYLTGLKISRCESGRRDMTLTTISIVSTHLNIKSYELLI